jgi:ComF family protein
VKESVYRLKYSNRREYAISYAQELARVYGGWIEEKGVEALVPIPLHPKRQRRRGYNQAQLIARELGRLLDIPVETKLLKRVINTRPQKELNDKERKNNLKKAFKICTNDVQLNQVLLVDDIYTTGSTMDGAAEELKKAGVGNVYVVSACIGRGY